MLLPPKQGFLSLGIWTIKSLFKFLNDDIYMLF